MRTPLLAALLAATAAPFAVPSATAAETGTMTSRALDKAISAALDASAAAWSRSDLDAFMALYEHSPDIVYINASGMTRGYEGIRAMYASRFAKGEPMGELSIALLEVKQVGPDYAFVTGRYILKMADGKTATGLTTLLFHAAHGQWRIVSDHTS